MPQTNDDLNEYEVTVRRGNNDRVEVLSITAESEERAEETASAKRNVNEVLDELTVEFSRNERGERVY